MTEDPEDAYWQAARAETARVLALYGPEHRRVTWVVRVDDGDAGEPSDWQEREEADDRRREIEEGRG